MLVLSCERVRELFSYDPMSGVLTWNVRTSNRVRIGDKAGVIGHHGYVLVRADGVLHRAHRLCWLHYHGWLPSIDIDHIDGDRVNNAISNLRVATRSQNNANSKVRRDNRLGVKGVSYDKDRGMFSASVCGVSLGRFDSIEAAKQAYDNEMKRQFGEYARL